MKKIIYLTILISVVVFTGFISVKSSKEKKLTLGDGLKSGMFKASVKGKGGHTGDCILMNIVNTSSLDTTIYIEAGRRLNSVDSTVQDILIVKEIPLLVRAGEEKNINIFGFCCQATNHSPSKDEDFEIGEMADSNLVKLAVFLSKNTFDESIMQNAVWVVSNNHPLSSVGSSNANKRKELKKLHNLLAAIKNLPLDFSWYSLTFKTDTARLFSGVPDSLYGDIDYSLWNAVPASLLITDDRGHVVHRFFTEKIHNPNNYSYEVKLSVDGWPKGKYYLRLVANNQKKLEREFEL
jgi:hypothetical protein